MPTQPSVTSTLSHNELARESERRRIMSLLTNNDSGTPAITEELIVGLITTVSVH
jgi:hypothetical protein